MLLLTVYAAEGVAAPSIASALGLDVHALLFQVLNFTILFFLLRRYAYKPVLNVLRERQHKINESLKQAKEIEKAKINLAEAHRVILHEARTQAQKIVSQSKQQGEVIVDEAHAHASSKSEKIIEQARSQVDREVEEARQQLRQEAVLLVALATEKVLDEKMTAKKDHELIQKAVREVSETI